MSSPTSGYATAAVILFLLTGVLAQHSVTLSSQSLCAVTGSTVKISCTLTKPSSSQIREREWYQILNSDGEEQVLSKDPEFSARVSERTWWNGCELTVRGVRVRDSGVYNFRFRTSSSNWTSASSGVQLTVTNLQVKVDPQTVGQREVKLTCSSSCSLGTNLYYYWYKNEQHWTYGYDASIVLDSTSSSDEGSYYCGLYISSQRYQSPAVCVLGKGCWGVTYTAESVCALKGSSVDLSCSYKYPEGLTVTKSVWFIGEQTGAEPVDVREDKEYQGRVHNRQSSQNDCSMIITDLRERDAQTYRFRFYTDGGEHTGQSGVSLSVTDLKITVSDTDSGGKKLTCSSSCTLPDHHTYIWYKNGQSESHCRSDSCAVAVVSGAVSYSCAVEGHKSLRSPPVYSPRNTRAVLVPSGERVEGDSVTLSCSSDADPPVLSYSWFKQRAAADTPLTTGQNYSITNISSQHSGLYYCTAHNQLGQHISTPVHLDVKRLQESSVLTLVTVGVMVVVLALILITAALWLWRRKSEEHRSTEESGQCDSPPVYGNVSVLAMTSDPTQREVSGEQDDVHYSSVQFRPSHTHKKSPASTSRPFLDPTEEQDVQYAALNFSTHTTAPQVLVAEAVDDPTYSQVHKRKHT